MAYGTSGFVTRGGNFFLVTLLYTQPGDSHTNFALGDRKCNSVLFIGSGTTWAADQFPSYFRYYSAIFQPNDLNLCTWLVSTLYLPCSKIQVIWLEYG